MRGINRIGLVVGLLGVFFQVEAQGWLGTSFIHKSPNITYLWRLEDRVNKDLSQQAFLTYLQASFLTKVKPTLGIGYWSWVDKGKEYRLYQSVEYKWVRGMLEE